MVIFWTMASAAPVRCTYEGATQLIEDARLATHRVPFTHPELLPGLMRNESDDSLQQALEELCTPGADLSLSIAEVYQTPTWSAHTVLLTRTQMDGCLLVQDTLALSVGVADTISFGLRGRYPQTRTPLADCLEPARWREEEVLQGASGPLQIISQSTRTDRAVEHQHLILRHATPRGWTDSPLGSALPPDLSEAGILLSVADTGPPRVFARRCKEGGQSVWHLDNGAWRELTDRDALADLAKEGRWDRAGSDAWFLIIALDDEDDEALLEARMRSLQGRYPAPLSIWRSSELPDLNPGFVFVAPDPWPSRAGAVAAKREWGYRTRSYVKRAWRSPCGAPTTCSASASRMPAGSP